MPRLFAGGAFLELLAVAVGCRGFGGGGDFPAQCQWPTQSDFRLSNSLAYNNYPWPTNLTDGQRDKVQKAAEAVLDARAQFPASTLADLYDPLTMPPVLAKAHATLDAAVNRCYRPTPFPNDRARVEHLFALYETITAPLAPPTTKTRSKSKPKPNA